MEKKVDRIRISAQYRRDIEGLRAIAVLAVVIHHAFPGVLTGGFVGVDVFFVISGYLISSHILDALRAQSFSLLDFYSKRIRRIFPSLIVVLASCLAFGWFCLFSKEYGELGKFTAAGAAFISNIVLWKTTGYFNTAANYQILLHLWSLGIEEQYYIVWPLFLLLFRRRLNFILPLIVALTCFSFALNIYLSHFRPVANFYLPITRFWELLIGVILAYLMLFRHGRVSGMLERIVPHDQIPNIKSSIGALLLLVAIAAINPKDVFPGWWALLPTAGTFLLISAGLDARINRSLLSHPILGFFGIISYPLYLWHWPLLVFARILSDGTPGISIRLMVIIAAIFLAWLTYLFIEVPLRFRQTSSRSKLTIASGLFAALTIIGACGFGLSRYENHLSFRFPGAGYGLKLNDLQEVDHNCKSKFPFATDFCQLSNENAPPTVVLLGDSHAIHFYWAMKSYFDLKGENILALAEGDCAPFLDIDVKVSGHQTKGCEALNDAALDFAIKSPSVHTLILSAYSTFDITGFNFSDESGDHKFLQDLRNPQETDNRIIYSEGLRRTVSRIIDAHKHVDLILDTPELDFDPASCAVHRPMNLREEGLRRPCGVSRMVVDKRQYLTRKTIIDTVALLPEVRLLDPIPILCDEDMCLADKAGSVLYIDRNHLSPQGAAYLVERFKL